jgi:hypothetical protein
MYSKYALRQIYANSRNIHDGLLALEVVVKLSLWHIDAVSAGALFVSAPAVKEAASIPFIRRLIGERFSAPR